MPTDHADRDPGALLLQQHDRIGQDAGGGGQQRADRHLAAVADAQVLEFLGRVAQLRQHDLGVAGEDLTVGGRLEPAVAALEQRHAERRLDVLQRLGDGRLGEVQAPGGLEDAARSRRVSRSARRGAGGTCARSSARGVPMSWGAIIAGQARRAALAHAAQVARRAGHTPSAPRCPPVGRRRVRRFRPAAAPPRDRCGARAPVADRRSAGVTVQQLARALPPGARDVSGSGFPTCCSPSGKG